MSSKAGNINQALTASSIKTKYESNTDTNAYGDLDKGKVDNLPTDQNQVNSEVVNLLDNKMPLSGIVVEFEQVLNQNNVLIFNPSDIVFDVVELPDVIYARFTSSDNTITITGAEFIDITTPNGLLAANLETQEGENLQNGDIEKDVIYELRLDSPQGSVYSLQGVGVTSNSDASPVTQEITPTSLLFDEDKVFKFIANSALSISLATSGHAEGVKYIIAIVDGDGVNSSPFVLPSYIDLKGDAYDFNQRNTIVLIAESGRIISATNQVSVAPDFLAPVITSAVFSEDNISFIVTTNEESTTSTLVGTPVFAQNGDDITGITLGTGVISGNTITYPVTLSPASTDTNGLATLNATITLTDVDGNTANVATGEVATRSGLVINFDGSAISTYFFLDSPDNLFIEDQGQLKINSRNNGVSIALDAQRLGLHEDYRETLVNGEKYSVTFNGVGFNNVATNNDNYHFGLRSVSTADLFYITSPSSNSTDFAGGTRRLSGPTTIDRGLIEASQNPTTIRLSYTYNSIDTSNSLLEIEELVNGSWVVLDSYNDHLGNEVHPYFTLIDNANNTGLGAFLDSIRIDKT